GQFSFDDPKQVAIIYSQYSFAGNLDLSQFDPETESAGQRILSFTLENPAYVARFIAAHFLNTEIGGLLALPLIKEFGGLLAPVNLYWISWDGSLEWYNLALVIIYLGVLAVGFGAAWHRLKWIALAPLTFNLGYALANGISRFSSWRYNLPVDWAIYFYFAIGIIEILGGLALLLGAKPALLESTTLESDSSLSAKRNISNVFARRAFAFPDEARAASMPARGIVSPRRHGDASGTPALAGGAREEQERPRNDTLRVRIIPILLAFIFIGALPSLAKGLAQPRYTSSQDDLIAKLESNGFDREEIQSFLLQPNSAIMEGRLLYPRMYSRNEGLASANPWPAYAEKDFPRIGFILINDNAHHLIFPTKTLLDFPQGADAILLACEIDGVLEVRVIDFGDKSFQSAPLSQPCN
ncbi:MAG: hypothetical protein Q8K73_06555, partial [Anaerolineales bacterium]|nr:hypothetical protein [Anaerolineales bacterium]